MTDTPAHSFVPITLDQAREVLLRLQWYAYHTYFVADAVHQFETTVVEHEGRKASFGVRDDGKPTLTIQGGPTVVYDVLVVTEPRQPETLDHLGYRFTILNKADLNETDFTFAQEMGAFLLSYVQRNLAFGFLSRMQPVTMDQYATVLSKMVSNTPIS